MTEMDKIELGYLWKDTEEYFKEQLITREILYDFNNSRPSEEYKRKNILKKILGSIGENVIVIPPLTLLRGNKVSIGDNSYINSNLNLIDDYTINIGKYCLIAPNVTITTTGHPIDPELRKTKMYSFPVNIGDNVWIGIGAIILPGISIGKNTVIGAGSVVTKDIPEDVVAFGNPCKVIRKINENDKKFYYKNYKV